MLEVDFSRPTSAVPRMLYNLRLTLRHMPWGWRLIHLTGILAAIALVYYKTILVWGTVNPIFVGMYTRPYPPPYMIHNYPNGGALPDPPPGWRPKSRVVVSLTTMPHHLHLLRPTLDSLLQQSLKPDEIYLNMPLGRNPRSNMSYDEALRGPGVVIPSGIKVNRCPEDVGPLTKLLPAVVAEQDWEKQRKGGWENPSDLSPIIITVDDDQVYPPDTVKYLAWYGEAFIFIYLFIVSYSFFFITQDDGELA